MENFQRMGMRLDLSKNNALIKLGKDYKKEYNYYLTKSTLIRVALDCFFENYKVFLQDKNDGNKKKKESINTTFKIRPDQDKKLEKIINEFEKLNLSKTSLVDLAISVFLKRINIDILYNKLSMEELTKAAFVVRLSQSEKVSDLVERMNKNYNINISKSAIMRIALDNLFKMENLEEVLKESRPL